MGRRPRLVIARRSQVVTGDATRSREAAWAHIQQLLHDALAGDWSAPAALSEVSTDRSYPPPKQVMAAFYAALLTDDRPSRITLHARAVHTAAVALAHGEPDTFTDTDPGIGSGSDVGLGLRAITVTMCLELVRDHRNLGHSDQAEQHLRDARTYLQGMPAGPDREVLEGAVRRAEL